MTRPRLGPPKPPRHDLHGYNYRGCRCDVCRAAKAAAARCLRVRQQSIPPPVQHGTDSTYHHHRCRCADCSSGHVSVCRAQRFISKANGRARKFGVPGLLTSSEVRAITGPCAYCGIANPNGWDHVVAMFLGGVNRPENLVPCCRPCNSRKGNWERTEAARADCGHWGADGVRCQRPGCREAVA